jgi:hypothetical protein
MLCRSGSAGLPVHGASYLRGGAVAGGGSVHNRNSTARRCVAGSFQLVPAAARAGQGSELARIKSSHIRTAPESMDKTPDNLETSARMVVRPRKNPPAPPARAAPAMAAPTKAAVRRLVALANFPASCRSPSRTSRRKAVLSSGVMGTRAASAARSIRATN